MKEIETKNKAKKKKKSPKLIAGYFEKINKIGKPLAKLKKERKPK